MRRLIVTCVLALAVAHGVEGVHAQSTAARPASKSFLDNLAWRHIGPASFGGRIDDVEAVVDQPWIIFIGVASGGIFKSVNNGVTWTPVFDDDGGSLSIGDIAIAPSDPNIVWAGSGEPNNRQSSSWGDGIYKSLDGGETWVNMGLRDSHHIGRVLVHPTNPDVVFAAALGHLWGPNDERGVYRTKDGGKTWEKVLGVDRDTGAVDIAMDTDGRTLFAATYQRRRRGYGFVGGGPGSGLHRSLDGGSTWTRLTKGLPEGNIGRIGVAIAPSQPSTIYAIIEHKTAGGVYRSDDRGNSWTRKSETNPRPMYYSQVRVDPSNPNKIWVLGTPLFLSVDGGKTFTTDGTGDRIHVDHHGLWINPRNADHMMLGNDGGLYFTYDGAKNWNFIDNLPIGQYYDIGIDNRDPYWVYGGTQDNGTWGVPSRTNSLLGITNLDVVNVAYGDGFFTQPDPTNPRLVYANSQGGRTYLVNLETKEEKGIRPVPSDAKETYRFNWSTPMHVSVHDPKVVFYGGNKLFRTDDRGQTWREASPDLTKNQEWKKLPIMGERDETTLSRDDGVSEFGTITTIDESPLQAGVLWVGTDDGNVQVSRDGGKAWTNVTGRFKLPGARWVSKVLSSHEAAGTAFVAFDGHWDDDFAPYVFKTTDFGATWTSVRGDLPDGMVVNSLAQHPRNKQLLLAGTEFGLYYSNNGGRNWLLAGGNLPRVPVDDIVLNARDNDIVLGTHGRSIIVLDDIAVLESWSDEVPKTAATLFPIRPATMTYTARMLPVPGAGEYSAPNPEYGALITYYLRDDPPKPAPAPTTATGAGSGSTNGGSQPPAAPPAPTVNIVVRDARNTVVREFTGPDRQGLTRVAWDLRGPLSFKAGNDDDGWFGSPKGPFVLPGTYTVTLKARGQELKQTVEVKADPRMSPTSEGLTSRYDLSRTADELMRAFTDASASIAGIEKELATAKEAAPAGAAPVKGMEEFEKKLKGVKEKFTGGWGGPRFAILDLFGQLQASSTPPTQSQMRSRDQLMTSVTDGVTQLNALIEKDWPALQQQLAEAKIGGPAIKVVAPPKR